MTVISINVCKDGGTIEIWTSKGKFYIDRRIGTETRNAIFEGYPGNPEAKPADKMRKNLHKAVVQYILGGARIFMRDEFLKDVLDAIYDPGNCPTKDGHPLDKWRSDVDDYVNSFPDDEEDDHDREDYLFDCAQDELLDEMAGDEEEA